MSLPRDHGGGLDAPVAEFGGDKADWIDLSTGINPVPYPVGALALSGLTALPDALASERLERAARSFWACPDKAAILAAPGLSSIIARIPTLTKPGRVRIPGPTYNEHEAAFRQEGWTLAHDGLVDAQVIVHPNNPDGRWQTMPAEAPLCIIDESFCDIAPERSHIDTAAHPGVLVLKSFGKFWGLPGLRLGFAIGDPDLIERLAQRLGPWPVSGPSLAIGTAALEDPAWAARTRGRLHQDALRLDKLVAPHAELVGGTPLFRLYRFDNAARWQQRFAEHRIWTRRFPYSQNWLRLGLPPEHAWAQLERVFACP